MKKLYLLYFLILVSIVAKADDGILKGRIYDSSGPLVNTSIVIKYKKNNNHIIARTSSQSDGLFIIKKVPKKKLIIVCTHIGYATYEAEVDMRQQDTLDLGILMLDSKNLSLDEVTIVAERMKYTSNKQIIYISKEEVQTSGSAYDILQKLPIPLLDVNPIMRKIHSIDPSGGIQIRINDIIATDEDLAIMDPHNIKRVEVIRRPGMEYGINLAMAINIVTKKNEIGFSVGGNLSNAITLTNGSNNIYGAYNRKNSQLVIGQTESYQNFKNFSSKDERKYLMPDGSYHRLYIYDTSARLKTLTHTTSIKYNTSVSDKYIFQIQAFLNIHKNPKQSIRQIVKENGIANYLASTITKDTYNSSSLNLYFKKHLSQRQEMTFNVVGTHIKSAYDYAYEQQKEKYHYMVKGDKYSIISEVRYNKNWNSYALATGIKNNVSYTNNNYIYNGLDNHNVAMHNINTNGYIQLNVKWEKISGRINLGVSNLFYSQSEFKYQKFSFIPDINIKYSPSTRFNFTYNFNLRPEVPNLSYQNNAVFQLDKWERRTGNPNLEPYNHIENSISASYNYRKLYLYSGLTYASNKNAIMPMTYRTITSDGQIFFDTTPYNQHSMNQLNLLTYIRYKVIDNKFIIKGSGGFNRFYANGFNYINHKSYFYGNFTAEYFLNKWYFSGTIASRYIATFAETTWYNEYNSSLSVTYNYKNIQIGLLWNYPLQKTGNNYQQITNNTIIYKRIATTNKDKSNLLMINFIWRWNNGKKANIKEADMNNRDNNAGILK